MARRSILDHDLKAPARTRCFFCGRRVTRKTLTREHVFSKWLQGKFNLWDQQLILLNHTSIRYRNLTVPACRACNGKILSGIENKFAKCLVKGAEAVRDLGHELIFIWLSKIFFGILYAESLLPLDRSNWRNGPILRPDLLATFEHLHVLMQAAELPLAFQSFETTYHSSVLVFEIQAHPEVKYQFMYRDDFEHGCIAIRLGTVGLILVADGGAQERIANMTMAKLFSHPLQFEEIIALVFARARSFDRTPKHIFFSSGRSTTMLQMPLAGLSDKPIFKEFDRDIFCQMLARFTGYPLDHIRVGDQHLTFIGDFADPKFIDVNDCPWP